MTNLRSDLDEQTPSPPLERLVCVRLLSLTHSVLDSFCPWLILFCPWLIPSWTHSVVDSSCSVHVSFCPGLILSWTHSVRCLSRNLGAWLWSPSPRPARLIPFPHHCLDDFLRNSVCDCQWLWVMTVNMTVSDNLRQNPTESNMLSWNHFSKHPFSTTTVRTTVSNLAFIPGQSLW